MFSTLVYTVLGCSLFGSQSLIDALPTTRTARDTIQTVRDDYTYTPGIGAHKIHTRLASWNLARRTCEQEGAYLGIINSVAEATAVIRLCNQSKVHQVYVGLHDLYQEDDFVTIRGESVGLTGFNIWRTGEPNNSGGNENCVVLESTGKFNDGNCETREFFVCELLSSNTQTLETRSGTLVAQ